jgi:hypothetical protein
VVWEVRQMNAPSGLSLAAILALAGVACDRSENAPPATGPSVVVAPASAPRTIPIAPKPPKATFEQMVAASRPLEPSPAAQTAGAKKLEAERCKLEGREFLGKSALEVFKAVEVSADRLIVVDQQGALHGFSIDTKKGCTLTLDEAFGVAGTLKLPEKIESLSRDGSGRLFASNGIFGAHAVKDGKHEFKCDTKGHVEVHDSGKWGIAPWVNSNVRLVQIDAGACKSEDWVLTDLNDDEKRQGPFANVNSSAVIGDLVLIGGVLSKKDDPSQPRVVIGFTKAGKEKLRFSDGFGWVNAIEPCTSGICVLDANLRRLSLWTRAGKHIASVELAQLLGLAEPWVADFTVAKDKTAWLVAAQARDKSAVAEGLVYRVRGL